MSKKRNRDPTPATGAAPTECSTETSPGIPNDSKNTESPTTQFPESLHSSALPAEYFCGRFYLSREGKMCGTVTLTEYSATGWHMKDCYISDLSATTKSAISESLAYIRNVISSELDTTPWTAQSSVRVLDTVPSEKERLEKIIGTGSEQRERLIWDWQEG